METLDKMMLKDLRQRFQMKEELSNEHIALMIELTKEEKNDDYRRFQSLIRRLAVLIDEMIPGWVALGDGPLDYNNESREILRRIADYNPMIPSQHQIYRTVLEVFIKTWGVHPAKIDRFAEKLTDEILMMTQEWIGK